MDRFSIPLFLTITLVDLMNAYCGIWICSISQWCTIPIPELESIPEQESGCTRNHASLVSAIMTIPHFALILEITPLKVIGQTVKAREHRDMDRQTLPSALSPYLIDWNQYYTRQLPLTWLVWYHCSLSHWIIKFKVCLNRYSWGAWKVGSEYSSWFIRLESCANLYANRTKKGGRRLPDVKHECYGKLSVKSFLKYIHPYQNWSFRVQWQAWANILAYP